MNVTTIALLKSFIVNLFLSICKIITGIVGKSSALIADGIHSFSDLATDSVAIFGNRYALKPADKEHPFGHGKVEYLTSFIIGLVVLALGFEIIANAFQYEIRIPSKMVIIVSLFTIVLKFILSHYLIKVGNKYSNGILVASGKESSMDVISSIFVLLSSVLMQFSDNYPILQYSNLIATIIVGILVVKTGFTIIKENMSSIIGEQDSDVNIQTMLSILNAEDAVCSVDQFAVIKNGPYFQITGEVSMDENLSLKVVHEIVETLEQKLKAFDERARYINIHVNPIQHKMEYYAHKTNRNQVEVYFSDSAFKTLFNSKLKQNNLYCFGEDFSIGSIQTMDTAIAIDSNKHIRIWTSHSNIHEYLSLLYFCYKFSGNYISVIFTDDYSKDVHSICAATSDEISDMLKYEHPLSLDEIEKYKKEWLKLVEENSDLRLFENGKVVSVNYDYLNDYILKYYNPDNLYQAIGDLMANDEENQLSDTIYKFLINRLFPKDE